MHLTPRPWAIVLLSFLGFFSLLDGCRSPKTPRQDARAAVVVTAEAVRLLSDMCADTSLETRDLLLARRCRDAYDQARQDFLAISSLIDAWENAAPEQRQNVACTIVHVHHLFTPIADQLPKQNRTMTVWYDAQALMVVLGPCRRQP